MNSPGIDDSTRRSRPTLHQAFQPHPGPFPTAAEGARSRLRQRFEQPSIALDIVGESHAISPLRAVRLFVDYGSARSGFGDTLQAMESATPSSMRWPSRARRT